MKNPEINKLEKEKIKLSNELSKIEEKIDKLTDKDRTLEFNRLKKAVEYWNNKYNGHFLVELREVWDKEKKEEE